MENITAIILAAGLGVRMGPRGELTPKGLIDVGGAPLVPQSVDTLKRAGVTKIVVVTGHLDVQYKAAFEGSDVQLIHNSDFADTGSMKTLTVALSQIEGPVAILESDLIYAPQVLDALDEGKNRFMVSTPTGAGDEVYTWIDPHKDDNRMIIISKDLTARTETPFGEMIGVTCLTENAAKRLRELAPEVLKQDPGAHYEDGLVALCQNTPVECVLFDKVPWAEMDDEDMLARVRDEVWPQIHAARKAKWGL